MDIRDYITAESVKEFIEAAPRLDAAFSLLESDPVRHLELEKIVEPLTVGQVVGYVFWLAGKAGIQ